eukprot:9348212-Pyramimonas_sp.AAC.1
MSLRNCWSDSHTSERSSMNRNCSPSTSHGAKTEQSTLGAQESPCASPRDGHTSSLARAPAT